MSNGFRERCDGVYIWPEGLAHYVRAHNVRLPAEVVKQIVSAAHCSDQNASRRAEAALDEDMLRRKNGAEDEWVQESFVVDKDFWAHAKLG